MRGYKAVRPDMSTLYGNQIYEIGRTYVMDGKIKLCKHGFHFCRNVLDCYSYYELSPFTIILKVDIPVDAEIIDSSGLNLSFYGVNPVFNAPKFCTNKMKIIRRVSQNEIMGAIEKNSLYYQFTKFETYLNFLRRCNQDGTINFDEFELNTSTSLKDLFTYYGVYHYFNSMIEHEPRLYLELFTKYINRACKIQNFKDQYERLDYLEYETSKFLDERKKDGIG